MNRTMSNGVDFSNDVQSCIDVSKPHLLKFARIGLTRYLTEKG